MADIRNELLKRILILDGAMGTFIQSFGLSSEAYHQGRFADWKVALTGNNDVLNLTAAGGDQRDSPPLYCCGG